MKLAEALSLRADIQHRIAQIKNRLLLNAKVQEGEAPAENPSDLLRELDKLTRQLEGLITQINHTNCQTTDGGDTITSLLARRDVLALKIDILRDFLGRASGTLVRNTHAEIKILSTVNVAAQQKEVDKLSRELRELDTRIQALNWTTELV